MQGDLSAFSALQSILPPQHLGLGQRTSLSAHTFTVNCQVPSSRMFHQHPGMLTQNRSHTSAQVINRLPIRPASWLTRQRHKTILQRMLCKGRVQALPINSLCTASFNLPLPRELRMAAQLSLPHDQVTWLPLAHSSIPAASALLCSPACPTPT